MFKFKLNQKLLQSYILKIKENITYLLTFNKWVGEISQINFSTKIWLSLNSEI